VDTYENVTTNARMKVVEGAGVTAIEEENGSLPLSFALEQNFPNPFNAATSIHFTIPAEAPVRLDIFNSVGQLVRVLVEERLGAGRYKARWHGRSDDGGAAASGVYFASLTAGQDVARRSIMLVK
jgi:methionine-rich copper-binding protein CopC